jgi:transcriptional regulator with XRE-family HTH domain
VEDLQRFLNGLSISQLARLSAIDRSSLSRKLNGQTKITAREAVDVSSIVGCDVPKLISWIESRKAG